VETYLQKRDALLRYFTARLGSPAAAEDLVQDLYVKLSTLEPDATVQNSVAFLYRMGSNLMLDRLRQQHRSTVRDSDWRQANASFVDDEAVADESAADDAFAARQRLAQMLAALEELPDHTREAFRLHKLEGLNQADTAAALGVSRSSIEKYISAALKHLVARIGR
jgi:RNA polymerase sigma-70 factor (ECF subfamily)